MDKYFYQNGYCGYIRCNSLNPVRYEKEDTEAAYKKREMVCMNVENGKCSMGEECSVFNAAPEVIENEELLDDKKL